MEGELVIPGLCIYWSYSKACLCAKHMIDNVLIISFLFNLHTSFRWYGGNLWTTSYTWNSYSLLYLKPLISLYTFLHAGLQCHVSKNSTSGLLLELFTVILVLCLQVPLGVRCTIADLAAAVVLVTSNGIQIFLTWKNYACCPSMSTASNLSHDLHGKVENKSHASHA